MPPQHYRTGRTSNINMACPAPDRPERPDREEPKAANRRFAHQAEAMMSPAQRPQ
jgi:hypothetical protein